MELIKASMKKPELQGAIDFAFPAFALLPMKLENLKPGTSQLFVASLIAVVSMCEGAIRVIYKTPVGTLNLKDRLLGRAGEDRAERLSAFDGKVSILRLSLSTQGIDQIPI